MSIRAIFANEDINRSKMQFLHYLSIFLLIPSFAVGDLGSLIDPFDMAGEQSKRPVTEASIERREETPTQSEASMKSRKAKEVKKLEEKEAEVTAECSDADYLAKMYNQLILSVWNRISDVSEKYKTKRLEATINIDDRTKHIITNYLQQNPKKVTAEVNEAFNSLFHSFRPFSNDKKTTTVMWTKDYTDAALLLAMAIVVFLIGFSIWRCLSRGLMRLIWPVFYLSWIWTWIFLYKKEVAKHHAKFLKTDRSACSGPVPWYSALGRHLHSYLSVIDDECEILQEVYAVDPWLEVHPFMALSQMIIMTLVNPASTVAEAISKFVRVIFRDLPVMIAMPVLLIIVVLIVILLLCHFNYRFRIPFLFAIEPSPRQTVSIDGQAIAESLKALERRTSEVSDYLSSLPSPVNTNTTRRTSEEVMLRDIGRRIRRPLDLQARGDTEQLDREPRRRLIRRYHSIGDLS